MKIDDDLEEWVLEALKAHGGEATIVEVAKHIWTHHEADLRSSDEIFFNWQYDMRWAGDRLSKAGKMRRAKAGNKGRWFLLSKST